MPFEQLPFVINPEKGYLVTANNRIVPDSAKLDIGASVTGTARARRLTEMVEEAKASG